jgi:hypothetical protein
MCDVSTAISAGIQLLTADSGSGSLGPARQGADASGSAALRAVGLQEKDYEASAPLRQAQRDAAIRELGRGEQQRIKYLPVEDNVIKDAMDAGSPEMQQTRAAAAQADVNAAAEASRASTLRQATSLGLTKPGDANYDTTQGAFDLAKTTATAQAGTTAREREFQRGVDQRTKVLGMAKPFNPNPSLTTAADVAGSANTLSSVAGSQAKLAGTEYERDMAQRSAVGGAAGEILSGVFKQPGSKDDIALAEGGAVEGPGGPKEDAVPAVIDGTTPAALSNGEYVIKAESVEKYGPRLLSEVNEGTAIIVPTRSPRKLTALKGGKNAKAA